MAQYLTGYHETDDYDDGNCYDCTSEDEMMERVWSKATPTVYHGQLPPPINISEDAKMESLHSDDSEDELEDMSKRGYSHITEMIRQVNPEPKDEPTILREFENNLEETFGVVLTKPLNPECAEFQPKDGAVCEANAGTVPEKENAKLSELEKRKRRAPRGRNAAIESLQKIKELERKCNGLMTPDDFKCKSPLVGRTAETASPDVPTTAVIPSPMQDLLTGDDMLDKCKTPLKPLGEVKAYSPMCSSGESSSNSLSVASEESPKKKPIKKKCKDFVPTSKTKEIHKKILEKAKIAELEKNAGRTSDSKLSDFIEVKLNEHLNKSRDSPSSNLDDTN